MTTTVPIVVIAGPTASGKTALALELAERLEGEIVGADSVQVYRGFDIGSAKPTKDELRGIRHHLIDVIEPDDEIDAMRFASIADDAIEDIGARGKIPIVAGGTGLWIRALVRGLVDLPPVDKDLRARIEAEVDQAGAKASHARLAAVDPKAAAAIHANDVLRIVRALEVHAQTGEPLGELRARHALGGNRRPTLFIVLEPALDRLTERIDARVDAMVDAGWLEEVRSLRDRFGDDVRALASVGYREWMSHLRGEIDYDTALASVKTSTRTYARRQRNWFRAEPGVDIRRASLESVLELDSSRITGHVGR